jgi:hypothetical protein
MIRLRFVAGVLLVMAASYAIVKPLKNFWNGLAEIAVIAGPVRSDDPQDY